MIRRDLVIIGAGGFGREAADVVVAMNDKSSGSSWNLLGIFDDSPSENDLQRLIAREIAYLGPVPTEKVQCDFDYVIGIGAPGIRKVLKERLDAMGWTAATLIHPDAVIGTQVEVGAGTVVCGGVQISTNVRLGRHVHINPNATVGHDASIRDFVSVNPAATISGEVVLGSRSLVGAGAVVLQGLNIGAATVIGASACVTKDVASEGLVKGVPAK